MIENKAFNRNIVFQEKIINGLWPSNTVPINSGPAALVKLSGQHPNSDKLQLLQPLRYGPVATFRPSGQQPKSVSLQAERLETLKFS